MTDEEKDDEHADQEKDVEELDERMKTLTNKLGNAREAFDYEKVQRVLDNIDKHKAEQEKVLQTKLAASKRKLAKAEKAKDEEKIEKYKGKIKKFEAKIDEHHVGAGNWQDVDTSKPGAVRFARLPKDTFRFVESTAYNATFDPTHAYIPVQHDDLDTHIYKIDISPGEGDVEPEYVAHVLSKNGEDDLTPFGSALSPEGVLWICMFNVNMVLGYDLVKGEVVGEVKCPAPNDVCLNSDGTKMWAGCGSRMGKVVFGGGAGTIHEASTTAPFGATQVLDRGQGTMAGIAEKDGQIYCAHLQRMSCYNVGEDTGWRFWKGDDPDDGKYYLCDNLAWWTPTTLLTPCYRELDGKVGKIMDEHADLGAAAWASGAAITFMKTLVTEGFTGIKNAHENGMNPECDLSLSKGDSFPHVHLSAWDLETRKTTNWRIDCDAYEDFDGHVTHAEPANGHVLLVNFMYHKIMIVRQDAFPNAPKVPE
mmetsp:Transcript_33262/g.100257  ORF Transcript_33262/g.100257 Transcript_33262/m.100257 type:complete len:478 (-) Transcript_33262:162-1595(-)